MGFDPEKLKEKLLVAYNQLDEGFSKHISLQFAKLEMQKRFMRSGDIAELVGSGADLMLRQVKEQCPVDNSDHGDPPGTLRDSLRITYTDVTVLKENGDAKTLAVKNTFCSIATDIPYAPHVEYGTRHAPAHPFMRPAFDSSKGETARKIGDIVAREIILHAATGAAGKAIPGVGAGATVAKFAGKAAAKYEARKHSGSVETEKL